MGSATADKASRGITTAKALDNALDYVGFWARVGASMIDSVVILAVTYPPLYWIYGKGYWLSGSLIAGTADLLISWVLPITGTILFWVYKSATPGKMLIGALVVDARTAAPLTVGQSIVRYLGYFVSVIPLGLGLFWVGWDARKQGWHDKMAGTVVVRANSLGAAGIRLSEQ